MARQVGKILVAHGKSTTPRRVVDRFAILALIPVDDAQAAPTDGAIHQNDVWILRQSLKGYLQEVWRVEVVDITQGKARPAYSFILGMTIAAETYGNAKGWHEFLLDILVGRLLAHHAARLTILFGALLYDVVVLQQAHNLPEGALGMGEALGRRE